MSAYREVAFFGHALGAKAFVNRSRLAKPKAEGSLNRLGNGGQTIGYFPSLL